MEKCFLFSARGCGWSLRLVCCSGSGDGESNGPLDRRRLDAELLSSSSAGRFDVFEELKACRGLFSGGVRTEPELEDDPELLVEARPPLEDDRSGVVRIVGVWGLLWLLLTESCGYDVAGLGECRAEVAERGGLVSSEP